MAFALMAHAQNAPAPKEPPPRVPFSAFRMKPILDPKLQAEDAASHTGREGSLVVDDKKAPPAPKPKQIVVKQPPVEMKVETVKPAKPQITKIQQNEERSRTPDAQPLSPSAAIMSASGKPMPPTKPAIPQNDDAPYTPATKQVAAQIEEMPETAATAPAPSAPRPPEEAKIVAPEPVAAAEVPAGLAAPGSSVRIDRNRFSGQSRMAGSGLNIGDDGFGRSVNLPDELRHLRVGRLEEAEGISPIIIPRAQIAHAPEIAHAAEQKIPPEVIVFFQENSDELEVGQMEILDNDVIRLLNDRPDLDVEIVGYADAPGGDKGGAKKLSQARALMIREYLVRKRIEPSRVEVTARANDTKIDPRDRADLYFSR